MKPIFLTNLKEIFELIKTKRFYLLFPMIIDMVFLLLFILITGIFTVVLIDKLSQIVELISPGSASLSEAIATTEGLEAFMQNKELFMQYYYSIITSILIFFLGVYLIYSLFQGLSWYVSEGIVAKKKISIMPYLGKFFLLNLLWFFIYGSIIFLFVRFVMSNTVLSLPLISQKTSSIILLIVLFAISLFSFISYSLIPDKKSLISTFKLFYKKAKEMLFLFLICFLSLFVILFVFYLIAKARLISLTIIWLIISLFAIAFLRVYFMKIVKSVKTPAKI